MSVDRIPPHHLEAESALLGAMMVDREMFDVTVDVIAESDFYSPLHQTIYAALSGLHARGAPLDLVAVAGELRLRGMLDKTGGTAYLSGLIEACPTTASTMHYAQLVREKAMLRGLVSAGAQITEAGFIGESDVAGALVSAEKALASVTTRGATVERVEDPMLAIARLVEDVRERKSERVVYSPWARLNRTVGGFADGELIVIPAAPAMGKTALAITLAEFVAERFGAVLFAGIEMGVDGIHRRRIAQRSGISARAQRLGEVDGEQRQQIYVAQRSLAPRPFYVTGAKHRSIPALYRAAREVVAECGRVAAIVVDHVLFLDESKPRGRQTKNEALDGMYQALLELASAFACPLFALIHLNREGMGEKPAMSALGKIRDGGNVEGHAHTAIFPYRPDPMRDPRVGELVVVKSRDGNVGTVPMHFDGARALWCQMSDDNEPIAPWFERPAPIVPEISPPLFA